MHLLKYPGRSVRPAGRCRPWPRRVARSGPGLRPRGQGDRHHEISSTCRPEASSSAGATLVRVPDSSPAPLVLISSANEMPDAKREANRARLLATQGDARHARGHWFEPSCAHQHKRTVRSTGPVATGSHDHRRPVGGFLAPPSKPRAQLVVSSGIGVADCATGVEYGTGDLELETRAAVWADPQPVHPARTAKASVSAKIRALCITGRHSLRPAGPQVPTWVGRCSGQQRRLVPGFGSRAPTRTCTESWRGPWAAAETRRSARPGAVARVRAFARVTALGASSG